MNTIARGHQRGKFHRCDMGISVTFRFFGKNVLLHPLKFAQSVMPRHVHSFCEAHFGAEMRDGKFAATAYLRPCNSPARFRRLHGKSQPDSTPDFRYSIHRTHST